MLIVEENISKLMGGRTIFKCPLCESKNETFVSARQTCDTCKQHIPNVFKLIRDREYRIDYYHGVLKLLKVIK